MPVRQIATTLPVAGLVVVMFASSAAFGLFRTRFTPVLAVCGLIVLTAAAALLTGVTAGGGGLVAVGSALIGFGVGASVSPALFIVGFSLRSAQIQRVFALVELLRGVTAFLVAPVLLYLAMAIGTSLAEGTRAAIWLCLSIAAVGGITAVAVFALGGSRLQTPNLERWNEGELAWASPRLFARFREERTQPREARSARRQTRDPAEGT
jgi:MFS family permease